MPWWAAKPLADEHRRALEASFRAQRVRAERRSAGQDGGISPSRPPRRPAPAADRGDQRQPVGHYLGNWLIRAGTRLGGASVRTS
jgi:hypothetical protein